MQELPHIQTARTEGWKSKQRFEISDPPFLNPDPKPGDYKNDPIEEVAWEMTKSIGGPNRVSMQNPKCHL